MGARPRGEALRSDTFCTLVVTLSARKYSGTKSGQNALAFDIIATLPVPQRHKKGFFSYCREVHAIKWNITLCNGRARTAQRLLELKRETPYRLLMCYLRLLVSPLLPFWYSVSPFSPSNNRLFDPAVVNYKYLILAKLQPALLILSRPLLIVAGTS